MSVYHLDDGVGEGVEVGAEVVGCVEICLSDGTLGGDLYLGSTFEPLIHC